MKPTRKPTLYRSAAAPPYYLGRRAEAWQRVFAERGRRRRS